MRVGCAYALDGDVVASELIDVETQNGRILSCTVKTPDGERMMPAVPEFVQEIDTDQGIFVCPIEGMFD